MADAGKFDRETPSAQAEPVVQEQKEISCPNCGAAVKAEYKFCNKCGATISASTSAEKTQKTPEPEPEPQSNHTYDYSIPPSRPAKFCPNCKLALQPHTSVCPRCGKVLAHARTASKGIDTKIFRTMSIIAYSLAGFCFFIGFINLVSVLLYQLGIGSGGTAALFAGMTTCLFMGITSLSLIVLGSTFLLICKKK